MLTGVPLSGGRHLGNLGSILLCGIAIVTAAFLLLRSERKKAAVGRRFVNLYLAGSLNTNMVNREMQLFLLGFIIIEICEIFSVGEFPLNGTVRVVCLSSSSGIRIFTRPCSH